MRTQYAMRTQLGTLHLVYPLTVIVTWGMYPCFNCVTKLGLHGFSQVKGNIIGAGVGSDGSIFILIGDTLILSLGESFSLKTFDCFSSNFSLRREQALGVFEISY